MGYTIGSGKDAVQTPGQTEQDYMNLFNKNDAAIWDYHQKTGKPLEDSFQAVVGSPWPAGRSIKYVGGTKGNSGNGFEFTKDRTVKSVLGKYVLPIAGAVAAPYLLPLLAGGGAAGGAAAAAGGGGVAGGGLGAGALAAGATIPGAGALSGSIIAGGTSLGTLGGASTLGSVLTAGKKAYDMGKVVSGVAQGAADGRAAQDTANQNKFANDRHAYEYQNQYDATMPQTFTKQAVAADLMGNYKGNSQAIIGAKTKDELNAARQVKTWEMNQASKDAAAEWQRLSIERLMNPRAVPTTPTAVKAGKMENILGAAGFGMQALGAYNGGAYRPAK